MVPKVIYDFGANAGQNLRYYLRKADVVVAVEANPDLADAIRQEFADEILGGRVHVVSAAITSDAADAGSADFFVYQGARPDGHVLSSLERPASQSPRDFGVISVPTVSARALFEQYGDPYYVKIDIEHHDATVLRDVLQWQPLPDFVSAEAHDPEVLALLLLERRYLGFQIVNGSRVQSDFGNALITVGGAKMIWNFVRHSAGPFGEDLPSAWLTRPALLRQYGQLGPGWFDIHASLTLAGSVDFGPEDPVLHVPAGVLEPARLAASCLWAAVSRAPGANWMIWLLPVRMVHPLTIFVWWWTIWTW